MSPLGTVSRTTDNGYVLRLERKLAKPAAEVWAMLTDPAILTRWLARTDVDLRVGGKFVIYFFDGKETMNGVISALERPHLIEYSWDEEGAPTSVVRWTITPDGDGCWLTLIHTLPPKSDERLALELGGGWHSILDTLEESIAGKPAAFDEDKVRALEERYRARFSAGDSQSERARHAKVASVEFVRLLPGPIEKVWAHLTEPHLLPSWFGSESQIDPRAGGRVHLMGGHIRGVVTVWDPPRRLTYTWNVFGANDGQNAVSAYPESYLSFTLEESGSQIRLTLSHVPVLDRLEKQNAMGWHTFLDILGATLRGEKVEERSFYAKKNAALYDVDMNNLER